MEEDRRALITHLMAEITARLEDATGMAVAGQSPTQADEIYREMAIGISSVAADVSALAGAIS